MVRLIKQCQASWFCNFNHRLGAGIQFLTSNGEEDTNQGVLQNSWIRGGGKTDACSRDVGQMSMAQSRRESKVMVGESSAGSESGWCGPVWVSRSSLWGLESGLPIRTELAEAQSLANDLTRFDDRRPVLLQRP
jgi:hypothetical protein